MKNKIYLFFVNIRDLLTLIKSNKLMSVSNDIRYFQQYKFFYDKLDEEREKTNLDKEELTYGETLYFTSYNILKEAKANKNTIVYDLGSGLGKIAYVANLLFGSEVKGIEIIPSFIEFTNSVVEKHRLKNITFSKENLFDSDCSNADIIYVAGTCFKDTSKKRLEEKMETVKKGARIITLSYSLNSPNLKLKKVKKMWFSWGWGTVFFQERI